MTPDREEDAVRLNDSPTVESGGGASPARDATRPALPEHFASLSRSERVDVVLRGGPYCIAGCGRPVPVWGECCEHCWFAYPRRSFEDM